ncbi:hypothetical protein [Gordonia oryzae]|uniref:hypothetical protein n=1 Tax=Gordonia oryzae TaxID=2487349 RepID=UPI001FE28A1D|nr:hypothetical protein [Gordonia oryzae]
MTAGDGFADRVISPGTLAAVRTELGRIRTTPTETLPMLSGNSAMVLVLWLALLRTWSCPARCIRWPSG